MGGPASLFLWGYGMDPLLQYTKDSCGCELPAYVDDIAALTKTYAELCLVQLTLLALSHLAGLRIATAEDSWLEVFGETTTYTELLAALPLDYYEVRYEDDTTRPPSIGADSALNPKCRMHSEKNSQRYAQN